MGRERNARENEYKYRTADNYEIRGGTDLDDAGRCLSVLICAEGSVDEWEVGDAGDEFVVWSVVGVLCA